MKAYLELLQKILDEGEMVENKRTGVNCKTIISHQLKYDVGNGIFPLVTTRKAFWKSAIAEMIGYIRGYTSAEDFRKVGTKTWDANANENQTWLKSPFRKGTDDMGKVYGAVGNGWTQEFTTMEEYLNDTVKVHNSVPVLTFSQIVEKIKNREDDRGLIWSFWNPSVFHKGCLRPCMYEHQFSILGNKLYLNSTQRSVDTPLGLVANMVQCYFLLYLVAKLTGLEPAIATHTMVNVHIYENQIDGIKEQLQRKPFASPQFKLKDEIESKLDLDYVLTELKPDDFEVLNYEHHPVIKFPFAV